MSELFDERAQQEFKRRLEKVFSDIFSDQYGCKITITLREKPEYEGGAEK